MGIEVRYPEKHADFVERCNNAGQSAADAVVSENPNRIPEHVRLHQ